MRVAPIQRGPPPLEISFPSLILNIFISAFSCFFFYLSSILSFPPPFFFPLSSNLYIYTYQRLESLNIIILAVFFKFPYASRYSAIKSINYKTVPALSIQKLFQII